MTKLNLLRPVSRRILNPPEVVAAMLVPDEFLIYAVRRLFLR